MPHIIDITVPLRDGMAVWPGDPDVRITPHLTLDDDGVNVSALALGSHTGTHIDAPAHLLPGGGDVTSIPLQVLRGPAQVIDLPTARTVSAQALASATPELDCARVLLRTSNSLRCILCAAAFARDYVALDASGARWLVEHGVALVGIDALSVDVWVSEALDAHHILLDAGVVIVEGLDLSEVEAGRYELVCAPLPLVGADGAPARAWLRSL